MEELEVQHLLFYLLLELPIPVVEVVDLEVIVHNQDQEQQVAQASS